MALIPPSFLDCVVAIGLVDGPEGQFRGMATGFLYGWFKRWHEDKTAVCNNFLIINRHVLKNLDEV